MTDDASIQAPTFQSHGLHWPRDIKPTAVAHAFKHVKGIDLAISMCGQRRRAVQAGGNIGLWPRRIAQSFKRVTTFEPEPVTHACLVRNVADAANIEVHHAALGAERGAARIVRESLASHHLAEGEGTQVLVLDEFGFDDVDLIQLDVEGFELNALKGARETIMRCRPIIQLEIRGFTEAYGGSDADVVALLEGCNYRQAAELLGSDFIFAPAERPVPRSLLSLIEGGKVRLRRLLRGSPRAAGH